MRQPRDSKMSPYRYQEPLYAGSGSVSQSPPPHIKEQTMTELTEHFMGFSDRPVISADSADGMHSDICGAGYEQGRKDALDALIANLPDGAVDAGARAVWLHEGKDIVLWDTPRKRGRGWEAAMDDLRPKYNATARAAIAAALQHAKDARHD